MKYVFKPYSNLFPSLFSKEKERIALHFPQASSIVIEHVGSTAIPGLGGKGIIDIAIAVDKSCMEEVCSKLQELGYEYRPSFSTPDRFYFVIYLPDPEEGSRRYHIHLTYHLSEEWKNLIGFRDYLRHHPEELQEYAELKKQAAFEANNEGDRYRKVKKPIFEKIKELIKDFNSYYLEHSDTIPHGEVLLRGISEEAFSAKKLPPIFPFSVFIKDHKQNVLGGISGATFYGSLYVDSLWIAPFLRKQGWGIRLMQEAEKIGKERNVRFVTVNTMDWEALPFYKKLGYSIEFTREGYDKNSKMFLLRKDL
jgi:GrpB-like predicted nucleotidyltransferase (UPF0157 family)